MEAGGHVGAYGLAESPNSGTANADASGDDDDEPTADEYDEDPPAEDPPAEDPPAEDPAEDPFYGEEEAASDFGASTMLRSRRTPNGRLCNPRPTTLVVTECSP